MPDEPVAERDVCDEQRFQDCPRYGVKARLFSKLMQEPGRVNFKVNGISVVSTYPISALS